MKTIEPLSLYVLEEIAAYICERDTLGNSSNTWSGQNSLYFGFPMDSRSDVLD